jgi:hypothetical protein
LSLAQALRGQRSIAEYDLMRESRLVLCRLSAKGQVMPALGSWSDGVEHSLVVRSSIDGEGLKYASSLLGRSARQKAVAYFNAQPGGSASLYIIKAKPIKGGYPTVMKILDLSGVAFRTLLRTRRAIFIYVIDLKKEMETGIRSAARRLRGTVSAVGGNGGFLTNEPGDGAAMEAFGSVISSWESTHPAVETNCSSRSGADQK